MYDCQCLAANAKNSGDGGRYGLVFIWRRLLICLLIMLIAVGLGGCFGWRPYSSNTTNTHSALVRGVVDIQAAQCRSNISCQIVSTMYSSYYVGTGTSFAAPHVSAAAALLLAAGYNAAQVESLLKSTARPLAGGVNNLYLGHGLLDIAYALGVTQGNAPINTNILALSNEDYSSAQVASVNAITPSGSSEPKLLLQITGGKEQALQAWLQQAGIIAHITDSICSIPASVGYKNLGERLQQLGLIKAYTISDVWRAFIADPYYNYQWGLHYAQFPKAWQKIGLNRSNIIVAVVDTGVNRQHEDLSLVQFTNGCSMQTGNVKTPKNVDFNLVFADQPDAANYCHNFSADDEAGHGTMVAGIIAADTGNGKGIAGAASGVKLMPVRVLGADGTGSDISVAYGIWYAAQKGAKVINLSLGSDYVTTIHPMVKQAIDYALAKGAVVVAASGNNGYNNLVPPANYDPVISVGAISNWGTRAFYSNYGPGLDLVAPGGATDAHLMPIVFAVKAGSNGSSPVGESWQVAAYAHVREAGRFSVALPSGVFYLYAWVDANLDNYINNGDYLAKSTPQLLRAGDELTDVNLQLRAYDGESVHLY